MHARDTRDAREGRGARDARDARGGRGARSVWVMAAVTLGLTACGSDSTLAPGTAQQDLVTGYWQLTANHQAVTLAMVAPYDTLRLVPTLRNAAGAPLTGTVLDSVVTTYALQDPRDTSLVLSADGLLRAHAPHTGSVVLVRTRVRGVTRVDSIPVNVTATVPPAPAATLALTVTPDTLTLMFFVDPIASVTAQVRDSAGRSIARAAVHFRADTARLNLSIPTGQTSGILLPVEFARPGQPWVVAEGTVYGVTVRDSVQVTITAPAYNTLNAVFGTPRSVGHPVGHFEPAVDTLVVGTDPNTGDVGALVIFKNATATPIDVVWDDPTAVQGSSYTLFACGAAVGGNIPAFVAPAPGEDFCAFLNSFGQLRLLPTPGTYHYHSVLSGTAGTIVVVAP